MQLLETISQLTPDGYFHRAIPYRFHWNLLPAGAVNISPPSLKPYEAARINETKDGWIIEEDLEGLHAPAFDFNEVEKETFVFDKSFYAHIHAPKYSLAVIRALTRHAVYKVRTNSGDRFFKFRGMETQNRLIYLNNNLNFISKETIEAYNILYNYSGITYKDYTYLLFKTKFGIEQSVYCMRLSFDYIIQIASYFLFSDTEISSLGSFLYGSKHNTKKAQKINELIFRRYNDINYKFLSMLNDIANCYKHSYLQAFADELHGEGVPAITNVNLNKDKVIIVSDCQYLQIIYAFHDSMAKTVDSIKDGLPKKARSYFEKIEKDPMGFI